MAEGWATAAKCKSRFYRRAVFFHAYFNFANEQNHENKSAKNFYLPNFWHVEFLVL